MACLERKNFMRYPIQVWLRLHNRHHHPCIHANQRHACIRILKVVSYHLVTVLSIVHHLSQLKLLGEFSAQDVQILDEFSAGRNQSIFWCDFTVGLNAKLESWKERMRDLFYY